MCRKSCILQWVINLKFWYSLQRASLWPLGHICLFHNHCSAQNPKEPPSGHWVTYVYFITTGQYRSNGPVLQSLTHGLIVQIPVFCFQYLIESFFKQTNKYLIPIDNYLIPIDNYLPNFMFLASLIWNWQLHKWEFPPPLPWNLNPGPPTPQTHDHP